MDPMVIIYGLFAGAVFALLGYLRQMPTDGESFQLIKALPTVILGGGIGAMLAFAGTPISEESIAIQMGVYGSLTVAIQYFVQAVYRWYTAERK
jgi:hypothetical protein